MSTMQNALAAAGLCKPALSQREQNEEAARLAKAARKEKARALRFSGAVRKSVLGKAAKMERAAQIARARAASIKIKARWAK